MPLSLGGGAYVPALRWKSNQISFVITVQQQDGIAEQPVQLQQFLIDFWNIRTGWCCISKGTAPSWVLDENISTPLPNPNPAMEYKRAFMVNAYNSQFFGGENVRQWGESAMGSGIGVQTAYAEFEAQMTQHQRGEVPIVQMNGFTNHGQYNVPNLAIVGWTPRPADFPDVAPEAGGSNLPPQTQGAAQGATQQTPPPPPPAQQQTPPPPPAAAPAQPPAQTAPAPGQMF